VADDPTIQALDQLIGKGIKSLYSEGDRVEVQTTGDLIKAREHLSNVADAAARPKRRFRGGSVRLSCSV